MHEVGLRFHIPTSSFSFPPEPFTLGTAIPSPKTKMQASGSQLWGCLPRLDCNIYRGRGRSNISATLSSNDILNTLDPSFFLKELNQTMSLCPSGGSSYPQCRVLCPSGRTTVQLTLSTLPVVQTWVPSVPSPPSLVSIHIGESTLFFHRNICSSISSGHTQRSLLNSKSLGTLQPGFQGK